MIRSITPTVPVVCLSSSQWETESSCDLQALESSALISLVSFKNDAKRSFPDNDDKVITVASHEVSDEESSSSLIPLRKRSTRTKVMEDAAAVIEASVPNSLYAVGDEDYINPVHNILRRDILEVFVEKAPTGQDIDFIENAFQAGGNYQRTKAPRNNRFAGRIGLRCRFCKHLPQGSAANLSTIYPETLEGIYRACSVRFQKRHLGNCLYIPREIKAELDVLGNEKSCRGSKSYWVDSALRLGFRSSPDHKGIIFCPELEKKI